MNQIRENLDKQVSDSEVLVLKENVILRGLVPLEELFGQNDVVQRPKLMPTKIGV